MLLTAQNLTKYYSLEKNIFVSGKGKIRALESISFSLEKGDALGVVGESGSGKTTLARILGNIIAPSSGKVIAGREIKKPKRDIQMVFQNPYESLDPRMTIEESLMEPLIIHHDAAMAREKVRRALGLTRLPLVLLNRLPHRLSGGQRQKIAIARAIASEPKLLICDEPTSSLDLSLQAQILNLLMDLQEEMGLALIFISHNLKIVKIISDRILVLFSGIMIELGSQENICKRPAHPYTKELMGLSRASGRSLRTASSKKQGCPYSLRCLRRKLDCENRRPEPVEIEEGHWVSCHYPID